MEYYNKIVPFDADRARDMQREEKFCVYTRDGYPVKILDFAYCDRKYPLLAEVQCNGYTMQLLYRRDGKYCASVDVKHGYDLVFRTHEFPYKPGDVLRTKSGQIFVLEANENGYIKAQAALTYTRKSIHIGEVVVCVEKNIDGYATENECGMVMRTLYKSEDDRAQRILKNLYKRKFK